MIDELTALRQARPEMMPADPVVVLRARRALLRRALVGRTRRRYAVRALVSAAAVAVVLGVVGVVDLGDDRRVNAAAAAVLDRAAHVALNDPDPVAGPGQYLRTTLVEQSWVDSTDEAGKPIVGRDGKLAVTQERRTRHIWVPHDPGQDWIVRDETVLLRSNSTDPSVIPPPPPAEFRAMPSWADKSSIARGGSYIKTYDPARPSQGRGQRRARL
jgi:hypothetical protein